MARLNVAKRSTPVFTHEGGPAARHLTPEQQLRHSVLSCLLWESEFYQDGKTIADQITEAAEQVDPLVLAKLAVEARNVFHLRHVPLLLLEVLTRTARSADPARTELRFRGLVAATYAQVIQRADEMGESLAIIFERQKARGQTKRKIPHSWIKGIRRVLPNFTEFHLGKYDRDGAIKLRDVLRIARPKPVNDFQSALWQRAVKRELAVPETWEVLLSSGADKKATFERLITEGKLGYLALLRNLRNCLEAQVDPVLLHNAIIARKGGADKVLPFRYVAAARAAPQMEPALDHALCMAIAELPQLPGRTIVLVDVSGSMDARLSARSDMTRFDAAAALGSIIHAENLQLFSFSDRLVEVPPRRGMAGVDVLARSQHHSGTWLGRALSEIYAMPHDRLIVVTDEQSHDAVPPPVAPLSYLINVASNKRGIGYGPWTHIDGFSEGVLRFIHESENDERSRD